MKITLAEAINLKSTVGKRLQELIQERNTVSVVTVVNKEDFEKMKPDRTVEEVTKEIEKVRAQIRELTLVLAEANLANTVEWEGKQIPLTVALELAKQLRGEVSILKTLASRKEEEVKTGSWGSSEHYIIATYDPSEYKRKARELERKVNKLSSDINHKNYTTYVEVSFVEEYL